MSEIPLTVYVLIGILAFLVGGGFYLDYQWREDQRDIDDFSLFIKRKENAE